MPTYEYKCEACGHKFDRFQSITAEPIKQCPECKKNKAKRLISAGAGLIFKGSGFYITDYRSEGYKEKAKAEAGGGAAAKDAKPAEGGGTSESKPATPQPRPTPRPPPLRRPRLKPNRLRRRKPNRRQPRRDRRNCFSRRTELWSAFLSR
jgi:putative FmdB family regulatory protein